MSKAFGTIFANTQKLLMFEPSTQTHYNYYNNYSASVSNKFRTRKKKKEREGDFTEVAGSTSEVNDLDLDCYQPKNLKIHKNVEL